MILTLKYKFELLKIKEESFLPYYDCFWIQFNICTYLILFGFAISSKKTFYKIQLPHFIYFPRFYKKYNKIYFCSQIEEVTENCIDDCFKFYSKCQNFILKRRYGL